MNEREFDATFDLGKDLEGLKGEKYHIRSVTPDGKMAVVESMDTGRRTGVKLIRNESRHRFEVREFLRRVK